MSKGGTMSSFNKNMVASAEKDNYTRRPNTTAHGSKQKSGPGIREGEDTSQKKKQTITSL